ncbi:MAG: prolipoprotein diacylglyceryl transferase [Rickettsiales bacterium]
MQFPDISPIALQIGPLAIRWYALAYVVGILLGQYYVTWLNRRQPSPPLAKNALDDLVLYAVAGIILGGRIGYVVFYNGAYYLDHPADILAVWHGGMSFHGGMLGVIAAFALFARRHKVDWMRLMDLIAAAAPIGLCLGRLANFINGELYGRVTDSALGMVFPHGGPFPRYPSQLFESAFEGLLLGLVLFFAATRTRALQYRGVVGGLFLAGYGLARFGIEFLREPDAQLGLLAFGFSMGQWLCVPMVLVGAWLVTKSKNMQ